MASFPAVAPSGSVAPRAGTEAPGFGDAFRSEVTKFRTLRSAFWSFFAAVLIVLVITGLVTALNSDTGDGVDPNKALNYIGAGWALASIAFMVLGILFITNEYATGLISNTLLATPRRWRLILAKVASFSALILALSEVLSFINYFMGHAILSSGGFQPNPGITAPGVLRVVIATGVISTLVGLMGMGLGMILKNTALSIVVGVAFVLVLPGLLGLISSTISNYWPPEAGAQFMQRVATNTPGPWTGLADFVAFVAVLLVAGGSLLARRDV